MDKKMDRLSCYTLLSALVSFSSNVSACTKYIDSFLLEYPSAPTYATVTEALDNYEENDVLCLADGEYPPIHLENLNNLSIKAINPLLAIIKPQELYTKKGIYIKNADNINIQGLTIQESLWGVYAIDVTNLSISSNNIKEQGQEGIRIAASVTGSENIRINNNIIFNTGKKNAKYGEGIYIGNGYQPKGSLFLNTNLHVKNVLIQNNNISNTTNEAIDIKANSYQVDILDNEISDINLQFNGAITIATSATYSPLGQYRVTNNTISNVSNDKYRPVAIAVGHGNTEISQNHIINHDSNNNLIAISFYTTALNSARNYAYYYDNQFTNVSQISNQSSTGGTQAIAKMQVSNSKPEQSLLIPELDTAVIKGTLEGDIINGLANTKELHGDEGNDILYANLKTEKLFGGKGDDRLFSLKSSSTLTQLYGEEGDDLLVAGSAWSYLSGGEGQDIYVIPPTLQIGASITETELNRDQHDIIKFDGIHSIDELAFFRRENDLHIISVTNKQMINVVDWFISIDSQIESIESAFDKISNLEINESLLSEAECQALTQAE